MTQAKRRRKTWEQKAGGVVDVPLSFESPESSLIAGATYDPTTETMRISLVSAGGGTKPYEFNAYPAKEWEKFTQAQSKGCFFQERIRPMFVGKPL